MKKTSRSMDQPFEEKVDVKEYVTVIKDSIFEYSLATFDRAFPFYADGLKPVIKRILYTMWMEKLTYFKKVIFTTGLTVGKFHPYADTAVYGAMVLLGQPFTTNYPYLDTQGNFGSEEGDPAAAPRYIECKLSKFAQEIITDEIDSHSIEYTDNYDWTLKEPIYLPSKVPLVLVQGTFGIGEAYKVSIPPHNLNDVVDMCIKYILNKTISLKDLVEGVYPDFPTGGIITNSKEINEFYSSSIEKIEKDANEGKTYKIKYKGDVFIDRENNSIVIKQLPFGVTFGKIKEAIEEEYKKRNNIVFSDIINYGNIKQKDGTIWYEILCKKDSNLIEILNMLYNKTQLVKSMSLSFMLNYGKSVKQVTVLDIIREWYRIRVKIKRRKFTFEHSDLNNKLHILQGLMVVYKHKKEIIDLITKSYDKEELINNLVKKYDLSLVQARGICDMPVHSLTKLSGERLLADINEKIAKIAQLEENLENIDGIIVEELRKISVKYGRPRKTVIKDESSKKNTSISLSGGVILYTRDSIGVFDKNNILKGKTILNGVHSVKIDGKNVKEIIGYYPLNSTLTGVLLFLSDGNMLNVPVKDIIMNNWKQILSNINESMIDKCVPIYSDKDYIAVISNDMKIRRFKTDEIPNKTAKCGKIIAADYIAKDVKGVLYINQDGKYLYLPVDEIPIFSRSSMGNNTSFNESDVIYSTVIKENSGIIASIEDELVGYITVTPFDSIKETKRTNKPVTLYNLKTMKVGGISIFDINTRKNSISVCIGRNSVVLVKGDKLKDNMAPKRIGLKSIGTIQIDL